MREFFRATIMLLVLVGLPTAWIYYGPLPPSAQKMVNRVVEVVKDATGWQHPHEEPFDDKTAPRFASSSPSPATPTFPPTAGLSAVPPDFTKSPAPSETSLQRELGPLLQQLQSMGPSDYSLEEWGSTGGFFRFRCAMPLGDRQGFERQFEAVSSSPAACIQEVMTEIAQWRGQGPSGEKGYSAIASNAVLTR